MSTEQQQKNKSYKSIEEIRRETHEEDKQYFKEKNKQERLDAYAFMFLFFSSLVLFYFLITGEHIAPWVAAVVLIIDIFCLRRFNVL